MKLKKMKKFLSLFLVLGLILTSAPFSFAADVGTVDVGSYTLKMSTDFEDSSTWEFAGNATTSVITDGSGNKLLKVVGAGSGTRSSVKTIPATTEASLYVTFDWIPSDVTTAECSSEVLFNDSGSNPLFRIVKAGGTNGVIRYGVGNAGIDLSQTQVVTGAGITSGTSISVKVLFDFNAQTISFSAFDKGSTVNGSSISDIPMGTSTGNINKISVIGNRFSGKTLNFTTGLDNVNIYGKAAVQPPSKIASIKTAYTTTYNYPTGTTKDAIISALPTNLAVTLENSSETTLGVTWDCAGYDANAAGVYTFTGTLNIGDGSVATNGNNIAASVTVTTTAPSGPPAVTGMTYLFGTDFEDLSIWDFTWSNDAIKPTNAVDGANHNLRFNMSGQTGTRTATKAFTTTVTDSAILFKFDWKPGDVTTGANSSEILFKESNGNPIFRLVKTGGTSGVIKYGLGTTGADHSKDVALTGISTDGSWLSVEVLFDFVNGDVSLKVADKNNSSKKFEAADIDLSAINYASNIASIIVQGNRSSGQSMGFETRLDNIFVYGSGVPAPAQPDRKIASIKTVYTTSVAITMGAAKNDVVSILPAKLEVYLEDNAVRNVSVNWDSQDYDGTKDGTYTFTGTLVLDGLVAVINPDNVKATVNVTTVAGETAPLVTGYSNKYYSTFGDVAAVAPANWGFTTANATVSINTADVGGNITPKLEFTQSGQSGGRTATKIFPSAVNGDNILVKLDWYPGKVNNRANETQVENGGDLRVYDSSNSDPIFTIRNKNNSPLSFFAGKQTIAPTNVTTPSSAWYSIELGFDVLGNEASFKLTDKTTGVTEEHTVSLEGVPFDGTVSRIMLAGNREATNNITWTTYLDNLGVYNVPIPANRIVMVDKIPYHKVYIGSTTSNLNSIGLPKEVTVTLADNSKAKIAVSEWSIVGDAWNPDVPGVYTFKGTLAAKEDIDNIYNRYATFYVNNRRPPVELDRQMEELDRGVVALKSGDGMFVSWRLMADEYDKNVKFNIYRNNIKLNSSPLSVTNYTDPAGLTDSVYKVETLVNGVSSGMDEAISTDKNYFSIPLQKPMDGRNLLGDIIDYTANDASVGDLDGDGEFEVIVKWYPTNAVDSSQFDYTGPTFFDAYKLDGTLLWRMDMGLNLTSGAHYNQFLVFDFDGDGKSEMFIKTADGTTVYGVTNGVVDKSKIICQIGIPADNGKYVSTGQGLGHITGGPEYISIFKGETGEVIDTVDYKFPVNNNPLAWGNDSDYNRSDRFVAAVAYLNSTKPSAVFGRGYYERTTFVTYELVDGKLQEGWTFDTNVDGAQYKGLGNHQLSVADVDNDRCDEIISGSLVLDNDGKVLYAMDGQMNREKGSHGDALHVGVFEPNREGIQVFDVHEDSAVAGMEYHDGATGETFVSIFTSADNGRGLAANITSSPGHEFWGWGNETDVAKGSGIYSIIDGSAINNSWRTSGIGDANFAIYWDGDLLQEINNDISIKKYIESTGLAETVLTFENCESNNGTKSNCNLQADIFGDWREEVLIRTKDSSELRIYSTTIPTNNRIYTLMQDPLYRLGVAWQNVAYNQPPHLSFYLGEDVKNKYQVPVTPAESTETSSDPAPSVSNGITPANPVVDSKTGEARIPIDNNKLTDAFKNAQPGADGNKTVTIFIPKASGASSYTPVIAASALTTGKPSDRLELRTDLGILTVPGNMLSNAGLGTAKEVGINIGSADKKTLPEDVRKNIGDRPVIQLSVTADGRRVEYNNPDSPVTVSVPYRPTAEELKNPENIVVWYIDGAGNVITVPNGRYDPASGLVTFTTTHFSTYAVAYVVKGFTDLAGFDWAKKQIEVLAAKSIIKGTSDTTYGPGADITRADFITLLVRTLELNGKYNSNFADVDKNEYYYESVGIAKAMGIVNGTGKNMFKPKESISRQDMMVMVARAMKIVNKLDSAGSSADLAKFTDRKDIAPHAVNGISLLAKAGILPENSGRLNPAVKATRADVAALLYKVYNK